jgi:hypothetical protein
MGPNPQGPAAVRKYQKTRKIIHVISTALFLMSVGYVVVYALRAQGAKWWLIFSLSAPSLGIAFLLVSTYLFAIYRGAVRNILSEVEHPLTSTWYYLVFYDSTPMLGCLAGLTGMLQAETAGEFFLGVSYSVVGGTFLVWVVVDPALSVVEIMMPKSRRHRQERKDRVRAEKQARQQRNEQLLAELQEQVAREKRQWRTTLGQQARELADLVNQKNKRESGHEQTAVDIGVSAWQQGGQNCMQELYDLTREICQEDYPEPANLDTISLWWDGIGSWKYQPFSKYYPD